MTTLLIAVIETDSDSKVSFYKIDKEEQTIFDSSHYFCYGISDLYCAGIFPMILSDDIAQTRDVSTLSV